MIGAGPGGLGAAAELRRAGLDPLVLEREERPAATWAKRYDRLKINTSAVLSYAPGKRFPLRYGRWPTRDQLLEYYAAYAHDNELDIRFRTEAQRIDRDAGGWIVRTSDGDLHAGAVVVATGKFSAPRLPDWPGQESFAGEVVHASAYRNAQPYSGTRALVVGAGSTALDIALDLVEARAAEVSVAIRTPPHLSRRATGGIPTDLLALVLARLPRPAVDAGMRRLERLVFGDLTPYGLAPPPDGFMERVLDRGMIPTIDAKPFVKLVKGGDIRIVPALERLDADAAVLADGRRVEADVVIAAIGYERALQPLVGHLDVLGEDGNPRAHGDRAVPHAPRLHFLGYTDLLTGNLRELRLDAGKIARALTA